jgi:hypothetical protein
MGSQSWFFLGQHLTLGEAHPLIVKEIYCGPAGVEGVNNQRAGSYNAMFLMYCSCDKILL